LSSHLSNRKKNNLSTLFASLLLSQPLLLFGTTARLLARFFGILGGLAGLEDPPRVSSRRVFLGEVRKLFRLRTGSILALRVSRWFDRLRCILVALQVVCNSFGRQGRCRCVGLDHVQRQQLHGNSYTVMIDLRLNDHSLANQGRLD
jgi:hypothetical protein